MCLLIQCTIPTVKALNSFGTSYTEAVCCCQYFTINNLLHRRLAITLLCLDNKTIILLAHARECLIYSPKNSLKIRVTRVLFGI